MAKRKKGAKSQKSRKCYTKWCLIDEIKDDDQLERAISKSQLYARTNDLLGNSDTELDGGVIIFNRTVCLVILNAAYNSRMRRATWARIADALDEIRLNGMPVREWIRKEATAGSRISTLSAALTTELRNLLSARL